MKGGAISLIDAMSQVMINNTKFMDNFAYHIGGAIAATEANDGQPVFILNCEFTCCKANRSAIEGRTMKIHPNAAIINTFFNDMKNYVVGHTSIIMASSVSSTVIGAYYSMYFTHFHCMPGLSISFRSRAMTKGFTFLTIACEKCPNEMYSLVPGEIDFLPMDDDMKTVESMFNINEFELEEGVIVWQRNWPDVRV